MYTQNCTHRLSQRERERTARGDNTTRSIDTVGFRVLILMSLLIHKIMALEMRFYTRIKTVGREVVRDTI